VTVKVLIIMKKSKNQMFGKFLIREKIGEGSTGIVYRATDETSQKDIALKILRSEIAGKIGYERFRLQNALMAQLKDPRVIPVIETGMCDDKLWISTPLLKKGSLEACVLPFQAEEVCRIVKDIASGLEFIHARGLLHLDLKPANIFYGEENLMLADFGLTPVESKGICGTPAYMAPELIRGDHTDFRADLYSLGVIAVEFLTGKNPFLSDSAASTLNKQLVYFPEIPKVGKKYDRLRKLLRALLDKEPSKRPPSALSVRMELQEILGEERTSEESFFLPEGPFIGRESEIEEICREWRELKGTTTVSVGGPPGIGKSAFCEKARIEIAKTGAKTVNIDRERGALVKILSPYFQSEYYDILRKHLPGLLFEDGFPQKLIEELEIKPANPPENSQEALFRISCVIKELTNESPIFIINSSQEMGFLWKEIAEYRANALVLCDDGHTEKEIELTAFNQDEVEQYIHGIFGKIDSDDRLIELLLENTGGNISKIRAELLSMGLSGAIIPDTYNWNFNHEAIRDDAGLKTLWQSLNLAEQIFATALALERSLDFEILENMFSDKLGILVYSLISKGFINQSSKGDSLYFSPTSGFSDLADDLFSARLVKKARLLIARALLALDTTPGNLYKAAINFIEVGMSEKAYPLLFDAGRGFIKTLHYSQAERAFELALKLDELSPDPLTSIKTAKRLGLSRKYIGDFEGSREAYYRALAMSEQAGEDDQRASVLSDIGVTFFESGDPERAIQYYDRALEGHRYCNDKKGILFDIINKAAAHQTMKKYSDARKEYTQANELAKELENRLAECVISLNLGDMDIEEEDFSSALPRILNSAEIARDEGLGQFLFKSLLDISIIYRKQGRAKLANQALDEAEELADSLGKRSLCAVYLERAALEHIAGNHFSAVSLLTEAMQYYRILDREEIIKLAVEYSELIAVGLKLPPLPLKLRIYDAIKPAINFIRLLDNNNIDLEDIEKLNNSAIEAVFYGQNTLALSMLIFSYKYYIEIGETERAERIFDTADDLIKTSDPYPRAVLSRYKSEYHYLTGNYSAARHELSSALMGFREIGNEKALEEIEEIRKKLETPEKTAISGLERLLPIIQALNSTLDTGELLRKILTATIELTGAERGIFFVVEKGGAKPVVSVEGDQLRENIESVKYSHSLVDNVILKSEAEFSENILEDSELSAVSSIIDMEITMALCVPVKGANGQLMGLIYADSRIGKGKFDREMLVILSAMADQAAVALRNAERFDALKVETERLSEEFSKNFGVEIIGSSEKIIELKRQLSIIAPKNISVLITGETGTGKELAARTIHLGSPRRDRPFIAINCAALPETLLESELFGHEKGAFTGADSRRAGKFEQADGGTLFLDEIAEMSIGLQAKLLRVLETRKISRLGGSGEIDIDVRIIGATNADPEKAMDKKEFRPDLYYRIAAFRLHMPPLRERKSDIPALAAHFVSVANGKFEREVANIDRKALNQLTAYPWFGNVRELASAVEEAVLFAVGRTLRIDDFPQKIRKLSLEEYSDEKIPESWETFLKYKVDLISSIEEQVLRQLMDRHGWNVSKAARAFKINRSQLHHLLNKYGIVIKE